MTAKRSAAVRVGIPTVLVAVLATAVMIAVNIATAEATTSPTAWAVVVVVTLASAAASFWLYSRAQPETDAAADDSPPAFIQTLRAADGVSETVPAHPVLVKSDGIAQPYPLTPTSWRRGPVIALIAVIAVIALALNTIGWSTVFGTATPLISVDNAATDVAVTPDGRHAYIVGNSISVYRTSYSLAVIDTDTNLIHFEEGTNNDSASAYTIQTRDYKTTGVAITPDGRHAYITTNYDAQNGTGQVRRDGAVAVIDTATNTATTNITFPVGILPIGVAITRDGRRAYVTTHDAGSSSGSGAVAVIDTATNTVTGTVPVGILPTAVAITPDGRRAYIITNYAGSGAVAVIDTATNTVTGTVPVGILPTAVAITPDGRRAYIATNYAGSGAVAVIDTATNTVTGTVPVGQGPTGAAITPDGRHAYITTNDAGAGSDSGIVAMIDIATNTVTTRRIRTGPVYAGTAGNVLKNHDLKPAGVAITPDGRRAYIMNISTNSNSSVSVIDIPVG